VTVSSQSPTDRRSAPAADVRSGTGPLSHSLGANISHAALHNRKLVLHEIRAHSGIDRASLAQMTGLTAPAVFKIVVELLDEKWIVSTRVKDGSRGQPRSVLSINPNAAYSFGLNVDRDRLCLVALDFAGGVRLRRHRPARMASPGDARIFVEECIGIIREKRLFPMHKLVAAGLSIPDDYGHPHSAESAKWNEVFTALGPLPVLRENDVAAASIGEMMFGAGLKIPSFFYLYVSAGLGGGLVVNRQYIRGKHGRGGELGFLPQINPFRQRKTSLGKTIEQVVSLRGLADSLGLGDNIADTGQACEAILAHDASHQAEWIEEASELLYLPLLSVLCTLDPDAILVGGRLPPRALDQLCLSLSKRLSMNVGVHWPEMVVRPGRLAEDAAAVGAAILALSTLHDRRDDARAADRRLPVISG
jgi:predicted NBD/HSP70 family sugar kinase